MVFPKSQKLNRCRVKSIRRKYFATFFWYGSCYEIKGKSIIVAIVQKQAVKMLGTRKICHQSADNTVSDKGSGGCSLNFEFWQAG